ncbi:hypothetical protein HY497_01060 [Candidatus Woesearchaeota archaeon]|nr:hypothetical protein [Candidatus Woesearchaeota archaeon]
MEPLLSSDIINLVGEIIMVVLGLIAILLIYSLFIRTKKELHVTMSYLIASLISYVVTKIVRLLGRFYGFVDNNYYVIALVGLNIIFLVLFIVGIITFLKVVSDLCNHHDSRKKKMKK